MLTSARRQISYPNPDRSDRPDVPNHILNLVNALDVDVVFNIGTDASRTAATHQVGGGRFWWASDTGILWFDDGTAWQAIGNAPLASPAFTGNPTATTQATADSSTRLATTAFVHNVIAVTTVFGRSGAVVAQTGDYTVAQVTGAAPLASPAFTGSPTAPTPATADNSTAVATTAFVKAQGYGTGAGSITTVFGRSGPAIVATTGDYTVAQVTGAAPLASPAFTGNPTAPTPAVGDNDTSLATTQFVRTVMPAGVILPYGGTAAPNGEWLMCSGQAVSRATYAALFAAIGTAYGAGDGSTTFNVPNLQGRIPVGQDTGTFATLGAVGGEQTHALNVNEMATHTHTISSDSAGTPAGTINSVSAGTPAGSLSSDSAGTPGGTVVGASAGTPAGSVHSLFLGSGGSLPELHMNTSSSGALAGDANSPDGTLMTTTFTGSPMGSHAHTFTGSPMGTHSHTFTGTAMAGHNHTFAGTALGTHTHTISNAGSGTAHNNLQPYVVTNYIIKI